MDMENTISRLLESAVGAYCLTVHVNCSECFALDAYRY